MSGIFPSAPRKLPKVKGCTQPAAHSLLVFLLLSSVFVDVEELCYFIEVLVLLPVFDDLEEGEHMKSCTSHKEPGLQDCHRQCQERLGSLKHQTETATTRQHFLHPNSHGRLKCTITCLQEQQENQPPVPVGFVFGFPFTARENKCFKK